MGERLGAEWFGPKASRHFAGNRVARLARFNGGVIDHPSMFGGGYPSARVICRILCVTFGYASVLEEFEEPSDGIRWCTVTVSLDGPVPKLVLDQRKSLSRPTPGTTNSAKTGRADFDAVYLVTAADPSMVTELVTDQLSALLLANPVKRVDFSGSRLLLRGDDGNRATPATLEALIGRATAVLQATPAFESRLSPGRRQTFPRGVRNLVE